jgi:uncharacterized damage-inducible protein DinB
MSFEQEKNAAMWGTYGVNSDQPLRWKRLVDCDTDHLQNILRTQSHVYDTIYLEYIHSILKDRGVKPAQYSYEAYQTFKQVWWANEHRRATI